MKLQLLVDRRDHLGIGRDEDLFGQFDHGDLDAPLAQRFGHLQPDVSAADHNRPTRTELVDFVFDSIRVGQVSKRVDTGAVRAGNRWAYRFGSGTQDQRVVRLGRLLVGFQISDRHLLGLAVDSGDLRADSNVDAKTPPEVLGRLHQQPLAFGNGSSDVVRQAAVGERDVLTPLEHYDFSVFRQTPRPSRRRSASGHAADDQDSLIFGHGRALAPGRRLGCSRSAWAGLGWKSCNKRLYRVARWPTARAP